MNRDPTRIPCWNAAFENELDASATANSVESGHIIIARDAAANAEGDRLKLQDELAAFFVDQVNPCAHVVGVEEADGHAGLTFLFEVVAPGREKVGYVLKLAPRGVRRSGNTDVYRQAPLLRALRHKNLPVPAVPWAGEDERWFGVPYIIMERLPGRTYQYWAPHRSFPRTAEFAQSTWRLAAEILPSIHKFDWRSDLGDWQAPEDLRSQVERWRAVYIKSPEEVWRRAAERVEALLLEQLPQAEFNPIGLIHGDHQPGNILYHEERATGVIDWELSGIGGHLLDIGWLMMMSEDGLSPPDSLKTLASAELRDIYEAAMGRSYEAIPWFRAYAGFRMGSIACLNVRLHRKGQRHDPIWEQIALNVPQMFENAQRVLQTRR